MIIISTSSTHAAAQSPSPLAKISFRSRSAASFSCCCCCCCCSFKRRCFSQNFLSNPVSAKSLCMDSKIEASTSLFRSSSKAISGSCAMDAMCADARMTATVVSCRNCNRRVHSTTPSAFSLTMLTALAPLSCVFLRLSISASSVTGQRPLMEISTGNSLTFKPRLYTH